MKRTVTILLAIWLFVLNFQVAAEDELVNLALGRGDSAVSVYTVPAISPLPNIFDGDLATSSEVRGDEGIDGPDFSFDLGGPCVISKVILYSASQKSGNTVPYRNDIYFATEPNVWHKYSDLGGSVTYTFISKGELVDGVESPGYICKHEFTMPNINAKYIRMKDPLKTKYRIVYELEVFGNYANAGSSVATLSSIEFDKGVLEPDFYPYQTQYSMNVEGMDTFPAITNALPTDINASVEIIQATEMTKKAEIIVTAQDGVNTKRYTINMGNEEESSSKLKEITATKGKVAPAVSSDVVQYSIAITDDDEMPIIDVSTVSRDAVATILQQPTVSDPKAIIEVANGDGSETTTYTVDVFRYNVKLSTLEVSTGELSPEFSPTVTEYTVTAESGNTPVAITATAADSDAQLSVKQPSDTDNTGRVTVNSEDASVFKNYNITIRYVQNIDQAQIAALSAIRNYTATNDTTESDIFSAVKTAINNPNIAVDWTTEFSKTDATSKKSGSISGVITLTLRDETRNVDINNTISKLTVSGGSGGGGGGGGGGAVVRIPTQNTEPLTDEKEPSTEDNESSTENNEPSTENTNDELTGHWGEDEIRPLLESGVVEGDGESLNLEKEVTRAEFATMLIRGFDIEVVKFSDVGNDVKAEDWFADYVQTAVENKIMQGNGDILRPNDFITREEAATVLMNTYELVFGKLKEKTEVSFTDKNDISEWAKDSVNGAVSAGLIKGFETGEFMPFTQLKREQAMVMIYRMLLHKS